MFSFSYSVTRQYPYRWFTPTAIVGGIVLTILFSAINFFSNAYTMVTTTTDDPDKIEAGRWSGRVPSIFTSKIQPKCEDAIIPIGSSIYTNQSALSYQLTSVSGSPALAYHNQNIYLCDLNQILIEFQTDNARQPVQIDRSGWGVTVNADIYCSIGNGFDDYSPGLRLAARYDPLSESAGVTSFMNDSSSLGFEWAEVLLMGFWTEIVTAITSQTAQDLGTSDSFSSPFNLSSGYILFEEPGQDMMNASYFNIGIYSFLDNNANRYRGDFGLQRNISLGQSTPDASWPDLWAPAGRLAKAMISTVEADLGQTALYLQDTSEPELSMITTPNQLHYWTQNLTQIWDANVVSWDVGLNDAFNHSELMQIPPYNETGDTPFSFSSSIISTTYTCQVPVLKSGFNIFISILVADLVLLRGAWTLYNFIVTYFLNSRHPDSNLCLGCLNRNQDGDDGREGHVSTDADEDTGYHGRVIELDDFGRDRKEWGSQPSSQKLLSRKPVGG
jgi:hypothetical protein